MNKELFAQALTSGKNGKEGRKDAEVLKPQNLAHKEIVGIYYDCVIAGDSDTYDDNRN